MEGWGVVQAAFQFPTGLLYGEVLYSIESAALHAAASIGNLSHKKEHKIPLRRLARSRGFAKGLPDMHKSWVLLWFHIWYYIACSWFVKPFPQAPSLKLYFYFCLLFGGFSMWNKDEVALQVQECNAVSVISRMKSLHVSIMSWSNKGVAGGEVESFHQQMRKVYLVVPSR